jgi:hypothetical protein
MRAIWIITAALSLAFEAQAHAPAANPVAAKDEPHHHLVLDSRIYENLLIFKGGGKTPDWNRMPLWTAMQVETIFKSAAGTQMVRWLRKDIESQGTPAN